MIPKKRLRQGSNGVTAIEYSLMAATIGTITIFTVASVGLKLDRSYRLTAAAISVANGGGSPSSTTTPTSTMTRAEARAAAKAAEAAAKAAKKAEKAAGKN